MILRSSSTPVLSSLHSSFTESPCNSLHSETSHGLKHLPTSFLQNNHKLPFHQTGSINFSQFSCNSSPISPSLADLDRRKGIRRAQSEGNLEELVYASCKNNNAEDQFYDFPDLPKRSSARLKCLTLETIPSFSLRHSKGIREEDEEEEYDTEDEEKIQQLNENNGMLDAKFGDRTMAVETDEFTLENRSKGMILTEEFGFRDEFCSVGYAGKLERQVAAKEMYLARGLGIHVCDDGKGGCRGGGGSGGGSGDYSSMDSGGDDGDRQGMEEYYKRMVEENPGNPLFLRNYAQFLYQCKQDHQGAEEYYSRAILADPKDGGVLSEYAKLVWEQHGDRDRASSYFERAIQASPEDSHVQAAYANFLWDTEEDEDEDSPNESHCLPQRFHHGAMASAGAA
ncbi:hypothetical protein L6164_034350 [Bauhinia variegata]|uniref:Uncharacterized protein n=1 Tax=Bauhinia variegata TaxID=167791 RepID=A0ACB9KUK0_BAUVA|nr:hypothetical protein L6164_034350 [Bauhinia variegata]